MSGFDKRCLMDKLIKLGWTENESDECQYCVTPPDSLWKNKPSAFYIYDAESLQNLLKPEGEDDD